MTADARKHPNAVRTWTVTFAVSFTLLVVMYGLAYWNEARGEAQRAAAAAPIIQSGAPEATAPAVAQSPKQ